MTDSITITADNAKCSRCGRGFEPREGRYGIGGLPGQFHSRCLDHFDPTSHRAGLIAGLREAAEWHDAEAEKVQPSWPPLGSVPASRSEALAIRRDISGHHRWSAMVSRARIAALETEEKK